MKPPNIYYYEPTTLQEAINMKNEFGSDAAFFAGGQILVKLLKSREIYLKHLISLDKINALHRIQEDNKHIIIPAMVTLNDLLNFKNLYSKSRILYGAIKVIGDEQIRNMSTVGGNLASRFFNTDLPSVALALNARVKTISSRGWRFINASDFYFGCRKIDLMPDEILTSIKIAKDTKFSYGRYLKVKTIAGKRQVIAIAVQAEMGNNLRIKNLGFSLNSSSIGTLKNTAVEESISGKVLSKKNIIKAAEKIPEFIKHETDIDEYSVYRANVAKRVFIKAMLEIRAQAKM